MVNYSDLYDRVKRAADQHIPKGEVLAWSHIDGTNITWSELLEALSVYCDLGNTEEDKLDISKEQR